MEPVIQLLVLSQLERALDAEVYRINRSRSAYPLWTEGNEMREIKSFADAIRQNAAQLRQNLAQATNQFTAEAQSTNANVEKLNSITGEMKAANKEVDALLADFGSNFPEAPVADKNGVTVNKGK